MRAPRSRFPKSEREMIEGRLAAAKLQGGASAAQPLGDSRSGARYHVHVFSLESMRCSCDAGRFGNYCWHQASCFLRLVSDSALAQKKVA
jgi:hypothetical protein